MKILIVFYSYSGNTRTVARALAEFLGQKGAVDTIDLKPLDESDSFLGQCSRAFRHMRARIQDANFDLAGYDLICVGTPVWAFGPAPAINTYLDKCQGVTGKRLVLFTTYGSGVGSNRCLDYMQDILAKKGGVQFKRFSVQQSKCRDRESVLREAEGIF